jgi:hypothetical protein
MKELEVRLGQLISPRASEAAVRIACFQVNADEVVAKMRRIAFEVKRELYKVVLDKVLKGN